MIGLMDCNNFFVSCERLFRPDLAKRPVIVLSSNDGCVVSRSQEVKNMGIPMGIPYFEIQKIGKKEGITFFSSNFTLYRDISERVMASLREEFDMIEVYSIDEAFFEALVELTTESLLKIRARILQKTGIPVSFGVGPTKTIAKLANDMAKKGTGALIFTHKDLPECIGDVSCGNVWGIGRQTSQKLTAEGVTTIAQFLAKDPFWHRSMFGVVGERLLLELQGTVAYPLGEEVPEEQGSISSTRSFRTPSKQRNVLESALSFHADHVARKLRDRGLVAGSLTVIASASRFGPYALRERTASKSITPPSDDTFKLISASLELLKRIYDSEVPYNKAGVVVSNLTPLKMAQLGLFESASEKTTTLSALTDEVNDKFGHGTLHSARIYATESWRERKELRSPEYTTSWGHIARVKTSESANKRHD